jgi:hypothetical protein
VVGPRLAPGFFVADIILETAPDALAGPNFSQNRLFETPSGAIACMLAVSFLPLQGKRIYPSTLALMQARSRARPQRKDAKFAKKFKRIASYCLSPIG